MTIIVEQAAHMYIQKVYRCIWKWIYRKFVHTYNKYSPICVGSSIYIVTKVLSVIMH
jgi:hypothetical protein